MPFQSGAMTSALGGGKGTQKADKRMGGCVIGTVTMGGGKKIKKELFAPQKICSNIVLGLLKFGIDRGAALTIQHCSW